MEIVIVTVGLIASVIVQSILSVHNICITLNWLKCMFSVHWVTVYVTYI